MTDEDLDKVRDMGGRQQTARAFSLLKPACCAAVQSPTVANLQRLEQLLRSFPASESTALDNLQEYIVFPINNILQSKPEEENVLLACLRCLQHLWKRSSTRNLQMALNYISYLSTLMLSDPAMGGKVFSEEVRLQAVSSCHQLWCSCSEDVLHHVFSQQHTPMFGYLVFQLTALIRCQQNRQLRVTAVSCLRALCCRQWLEDRYSLIVKSSGVFVSFLPGILSALFSVIAGDVKQGQQVISSAVDGFCAMLCHVIDDNISPVDIDSPQNGDCEATERRIPLVSRSEKWLCETMDRVRTMLERFVILTRHHHRSVRLSLVNLCDRCFQHCCRSTERVHDQLIKLLVLLSCDSCHDVKQSAEQVLKQLSQQLSDKAGGFSDLLWQHVEQLLPTLPDRVQSHDPDLACTAITLLEGYLRAIAGDLNRILLAESRLRCLLSTLVTLAELKPVGSVGAIRRICPSDQSVCDGDIKDQTILLVAEPWRLLLCDTPDLWHHLCQCCHLIGYHGDILTVLEWLQGMIDDDTETKANQAQLVWNQVILGKLPSSHDSVSASSKLSGWQSHLPLDWLLQYVDNHDASDIKRCLSLQAVAHVARASGPECVALRQLQVRALAPVLEAAGAEKQCVADMASLTLHYLTEKEGARCTLQQHLSRLCVHVCCRLRDHSREAALSVCCMLRALLPHLTASEADSEALFHLQLPIKQLLLFLDLHYRQCAAIIVDTLGRVLDRFLEWFAVPVADPAQPLPAHARPTARDGVDKFLEYHRQQLEIGKLLKRDSSGLDAAETDDTEDGDSGVNDCSQTADLTADTTTPAEKPAPLYVQLTCLVCEHCSRLLDIDSTPVKVSILHALAAGFRLLCGHHSREIEDAVLPLLHKCWQPMIRCIDSTQSVHVLMAALQCVETAASAGGDFLRRRFSQQLLRPLLSWLARAAFETAGCRRYYQLTAQCRLLKEAVKALPRICTSLQVDSVCVMEAVDVLWPYLHCKQPPVLQDSCVEAVASLARYNGDTVWWCLRHKSNQVPELEMVNFRTNLDSILSLPDLL